MKRKLSAAVLAAAIACPLGAHAQSVTIIGEGNPGASGATRNTTGASAYKNTTREDAGAAGASTSGGATVVSPIPSSAGRSDGSGMSANTGTRGGAEPSPGSTGGTTGSVGTGGTSGAASGGASTGGAAGAR